MMIRLLVCLIMLQRVLVGAENQPSDIQAFNKAFGLPLLVDQSLWDDEADVVAKRLNLNKMSSTSDCALYNDFSQDGLKEELFGAKALCLTVYARNNKPTYIYAVFANKGEVAGHGNPSNKTGVRQKIVADYNELGQSISKKLGAPFPVEFNVPYRYSCKIWGWRFEDTAITLSCPFDEITELRVMPLQYAKQGTITIDRAVTSDGLLKRVQKAANGDVTLADVIMVEQTLARHCVPTTSERFLRYYGFNAEYYLLSVMMRTGWGGGTDITNTQEVLKGFTKNMSLKMEVIDKELSLPLLKEYTDRGYLVIWRMSTDRELYSIVQRRLEARNKSSLDAKYQKWLQKDEEKAVRAMRSFKLYHVCLFTGYNERTNEISFSDGAAPESASYWLTEREVKTLSRTGHITFVISGSTMNKQGK